MSLILRLVGAPGRTLRKLERLEWAALLVEMARLVAFLRGSGRAARPLVGTGPDQKGRTFWGLVFGSGLLLPWLLQSVGLFGTQTEKRRRGRGILISLLVLSGGYFLRKTSGEAGHTSSKDARTTLWHARSKDEWR